MARTGGCITGYDYDPEHDYAAASAFGPDPEFGMKIRSGRYPDWQIIGQPRNRF
ncbi:MAG: hypothetical protein M1608_06510 [Candidatus Omnitrophica bacterium]|nr:hypothetical protein [Candidatus Omnitrophota bacterium]